MTTPVIGPSPSSMGAAMQYAESVLGGPLVESTAFSTVATTATEVAPQNSDRVELILTNNGLNDAWVSTDPNLSTSTGIRLNAGGGSMVLIVTEDFTLVGRRWFAIVSTGTSRMDRLEMARFAYRAG